MTGRSSGPVRGRIVTSPARNIDTPSAATSGTSRKYPTTTPATYISATGMSGRFMPSQVRRHRRKTTHTAINPSAAPTVSMPTSRREPVRLGTND